MSKQALVSLAILLALCYPVFFLHLNEPVMHLWDESSYAHNAMQMIKHKKPLVVYAFDVPDTYNTKPPFVVWMMAISIYFLGWTELAVRLPSAIAGCLCVLLVFWGMWRITKNLSSAWLSAVVLLTASAFADWHIARTGDTDSFLALFIAGSVIFFKRFLDTSQRHLWILFLINFILACLSKGVSGLLVLPGISVYLMLNGSVRHLMPHRNLVLVSILAWLLIVPGYYIMRQIWQPDFMQAVIRNELGGRFHTQSYINPYGSLPFWYYLEAMYNQDRFLVWAWLLPIVVCISLWKIKDKSFQYFLLVTLGLLFVISFSKTKVSWYDAPLYPLFAVLFGLTFYQLQHKVFAGIVFCLLIILATIPYYKILNRNLHPQNEFDFPLALDYLRKERMISSPIKVFERHMMYPIHFYMVKDSLQGFCSTFDNPLNSHLKINDLVLTLTDEREKELIALYRTQKIDSYYNCTLHRIINVGNND